MKITKDSKTDSKETLMLNFKISNADCWKTVYCFFQGYFLGILNKNNKITNYDRRTIIEKI